MSLALASTSSRVSSFLDIHDLGDQLGVSPATLYRWRSEGVDMPKAFKIGSRVRWTQESVDAWIAEQIEKADD